jgi:hypothetical protein
MLPVLPVARLCDCILEEATSTIRAQLEKIAKSADEKKYGDALRQTNFLLKQLESNVQMHVEQWREQHARAMIDVAKMGMIAPSPAARVQEDASVSFQTHATKRGDVEKLRAPPVNKKKKQKTMPKEVGQA